MRIAQSSFACTLAALIISAIPTGHSQAQAQDVRPLDVLGRTVQVRSYPVPEGADDFSSRRKTATETALREVLSERGVPLLEEGSMDQDQIRLIYPDAFVVITGRYSNGIICRVEVPTLGLRDGLPADTVTVLATRRCRAEEERGWGSRGHDRPTAIGTEAVPNIPGAKASVYATNSLAGLFPDLVRDVEIQNKTAASLVRGYDRNDQTPRSGAAEWRYAWFSNGTLLAVRYKPSESSSYGDPGVGLACVVVAPAADLGSLEQGAFATWCTQKVNQLRPNLPNFVSAVRDYRNKQYEARKNEKQDGIPSVSTGFHFGEFPPALTEAFWKTGKVSTLSPQ